MYTNADYTEMLLIYGEVQRNEREACWLYQQCFPNKRHPPDTMFPRMERHLHETGSLSPNKHPCGCLRRCHTPDFEEAVIQHFERAA
jgi:hypothetical protein